MVRGFVDRMLARLTGISALLILGLNSKDSRAFCLKFAQILESKEEHEWSRPRQIMAMTMPCFRERVSKFDRSRAAVMLTLEYTNPVTIHSTPRPQRARRKQGFVCDTSSQISLSKAHARLKQLIFKDSLHNCVLVQRDLPKWCSVYRLASFSNCRVSTAWSQPDSLEAALERDWIAKIIMGGKRGYVVMTGVSSGIGRASLIHLLQEGYVVYGR